MKIRTKGDRLGPMLDGDRLRVPTFMMDEQTIANRKTYFDAAGWHRPGYRTSVVRTAARDEISGIYQEYDRAKGEEWRSPESALARAKATAAEAGPMKGNSDPDDPEYKAWRRKQSAAPFVERGKDDAATCPHCTTSFDPDDDDEDDADAIVRASTSGVEGIIRQDVPDAMSLKELQADHKAIMDAVYAEEAEALRNAWRK